MTHTILAFAGPEPVEVIPAWIWLLLIAAGVVASITDLRNTRIPNWLTLPLLAGGLMYASSQGLPAVGQALAGMVAAGLFLVIAYILMGGGAGDAKLMLAFGSWLGFDASMILMLGVAIISSLDWHPIFEIFAHLTGSFVDEPAVVAARAGPGREVLRRIDQL